MEPNHTHKISTKWSNQISLARFFVWGRAHVLYRVFLIAKYRCVVNKSRIAHHISVFMQFSHVTFDFIRPIEVSNNQIVGTSSILCVAQKKTNTNSMEIWHGQISEYSAVYWFSKLININIRLLWVSLSLFPLLCVICVAEPDILLSIEFGSQPSAVILLLFSNE